MKIVLDSNILFSALISGKKIYLDFFKAMEVYTSDFAFEEIAKYEKRIIKKNKLQEEFRFFVQTLFSEITVIPRLGISQKNFDQAYHLCEDIDPKDTLFVALSMELKLPLWTNDKKLLQGLKKKGYTNLVTTEEIFELAIL